MVKRYEPAPGGGMMERSGGKYFHERDVKEIIENALILRSIVSPDDINFVSGISDVIDFFEELKSEPI